MPKTSMFAKNTHVLGFNQTEPINAYATSTALRQTNSQVSFNYLNY